MSETTCRRGEVRDFGYIDSLRKREGDALGFVPRAVYDSVLSGCRVANRDRWRYQDIWVTEDNGDLTGFLMVSHAHYEAHIFQIAVQADARRWHRALMLADAVEREARRRHNVSIRCRVAFDLESNFFWRAIGYVPIDTVISTWLNQRESKSKRPLILYEKKIVPTLFDSIEV